MALIQCPDCKTEVSSKATACTSCNYQLNSAKDQTTTNIIGYIIVYLVIGFIAGGVLLDVIERQFGLERISTTMSLFIVGVFLLLGLIVVVLVAQLIRIAKNPSSGSNLKSCPFCAEKIQVSAKICRFCNRDLST